MLTKGTRIKSTFLTKEGEYIYGTIKAYQEPSGILADGYFIKFDDCPTTLFINRYALNELYVVIEEKLDEDVYQVNDNGQISFI